MGRGLRERALRFDKDVAHLGLRPLGLPLGGSYRLVQYSESDPVPTLTTIASTSPAHLHDSFLMVL